MPELTGLRRVAQDSREERTFRVWLQSLLRDQVALGSLAEGLRDGARPRSASMLVDRVCGQHMSASIHRLSVSGHKYMIFGPHSHKSKPWVGLPAVHPVRPVQACELVAGLPQWRAGYWLLRVLDVLAPDAVDWRSAHKPPLRPLLRRPQSIENCNQARCASLPGQASCCWGSWGLTLLARRLTRVALSGGIEYIGLAWAGPPHATYMPLGVSVFLRVILGRVGKGTCVLGCGGSVCLNGRCSGAEFIGNGAYVFPLMPICGVDGHATSPGNNLGHPCRS